MVGQNVERPPVRQVSAQLGDAVSCPSSAVRYITLRASVLLVWASHASPPSRRDCPHLLLCSRDCARHSERGGFSVARAWSEAMWRLKPEVPAQFAALGRLAISLMVLVAAACAGAAIGLWRQRWGHRLAVGLLAVNLIGDTLNAVLRGDWRTLIGLPVGAVMLAYLLGSNVRDRFGTSSRSVLSA